MENKEKISKAISEFAEKHNLHIHPGQEPNKWAELVIKNGGCPCVPGRIDCPCELVLEDIRKLGRCRCGLFCDDKYLREYNELRQKRKKK